MGEIWETMGEILLKLEENERKFVKVPVKTRENESFYKVGRKWEKIGEDWEKMGENYQSWEKIERNWEKIYVKVGDNKRKWEKVYLKFGENER